jgi:hypothetical protein
MTRPRIGLIAAIRTASLAALAAMALAGSMLAESAQERLATSVKDAKEQMQNARTDLQNTVGALNELRNQTGDLRPAYEKFSESIEKTRGSAGLASKLFDTMSADSKTYFDGWRSEISGISNKDIQKVSSKRMNTVQEQYNDALKQMKPIPPLFYPMMSDLDDFKKALGMDLTPAGLKALSKSMNKTNKSLTNFQEPITRSLVELDKLSTDLTPAAPAAN